MFKLKNHEILLSSLTTRTQKAGDEDEPAISLKLEMTVSNAWMDEYQPGLLKAFYTNLDNNKNQQDLPTNDLFPDLLFSRLKPIEFDEEHPGYRVKIVDELDPKQNKFILSDCTLKRFKFDMQQGGSVIVTFTLNAQPNGDVVGWLYERQKHIFPMTFEPPSANKIAEIHASAQAA